MSKTKFEKVENPFGDLKNTVCNAKVCGNIVEVSHSLFSSKGNGIKKLDKDRYINTKKPYTLLNSTFYLIDNNSEILDKQDFDNYSITEYEHYLIISINNLETQIILDFVCLNEDTDSYYKIGYYKKNENRSQSPNELRKTFKRITDIINCNTADYWKCRFITLTYPENMQDRQKLYKDFNNFKKKLIRHIGNFEYITVAEPQERGAWHLHIIFIFPTKAPYIPNIEIAKLWGNGFTTTTNIKKNNNPGIYLTAYLSNIPVERFESLPKKEQNNIINYIGGYTEIEDKEKKRYVKGGRLYFYPVGFNILRTSRGVKRPILFKATKESILKKYELSPENLTFQKTVKLTVSNDTDEQIQFENIFHREFYNKKVLNLKKH